MKKVIYAVMAFAPVMALAQNLGNLNSLVTSISSLLNRVIPLLFAIAIIILFWGIIKFVRSAGDPKLAAEGKSIMIYGVIALAVMVSIYGLINWLGDAAGLNNTTPNLPVIPVR